MLILILILAEEREGVMLFLNHCCDPNVGVKGQIVFVAMRDIQPSKEITQDWAMTDDDEATNICKWRFKSETGGGLIV